MDRPLRFDLTDDHTQEAIDVCMKALKKAGFTCGVSGKMGSRTFKVHIVSAENPPKALYAQMLQGLSDAEVAPSPLDDKIRSNFRRKGRTPNPRDRSSAPRPLP